MVGIGFAIAAAVAAKIVPRVSVAKKRVPVPFSVTGSALAQYSELGTAAGALHVAAIEPTGMAVEAGANVTTYPLLVTPVDFRSGLTPYRSATFRLDQAPPSRYCLRSTPGNLSIYKALAWNSSSPRWRKPAKP